VSFFLVNGAYYIHQEKIPEARINADAPGKLCGTQAEMEDLNA